MTVRELIEALKQFPENARVVTGCMPGVPDEPEITFSAKFDVVRLEGSCDGEDLP